MWLRLSLNNNKVQFIASVAWKKRNHVDHLIKYGIKIFFFDVVSARQLWQAKIIKRN